MSAPASQAHLVTLEGGEGAGKSTQAGLLVERLRCCGIDAIATREPGGTPSAEEIRRLLVTGDPARWDKVTELLLHFAARREHLAGVVWPALAANRWVVSDRFADSTMAYQGVALGVGESAVNTLYGLAVGSFAPTLTIMLDVPVEVGLTRAQRRGGDDRYERLGPAFHRRLRQAFLAIAKREPERCRVVDAAGSVEDVAAAIWRVVAERFRLAAKG